MMPWLTRVVVAMIAVLLPAGALAATAVDARGPGAGDRRVGAAGFAQEGVAGEQPVASATTAPAVVTTTMPPPPTTARPPAPTTTTAPRPKASAARAPAAPATTAATLLPGLPLPAVPPIPLPQPPVDTWSSSTGPVSVRMRMEPATPLPGQPVRFLVDINAPEACCAANLSYGDGMASPNPPGNCDSPTTRTLTLTHTFATPGDYELLLVAMTFPCKVTVVGGQFVPPPVYGASIKTCITVGIRLLGQPSCTPYNHFGPGTVVSAA